MYYTLLRLYTEGRLKDNMLDNAVAKSWITEEEKQEILLNNTTS